MKVDIYQELFQLKFRLNTQYGFATNSMYPKILTKRKLKRLYNRRKHLTRKLNQMKIQPR